MKKLTMIIPCYNEGEVLPLFYRETTKALSVLNGKYEYNLLFVDDGSSDNTLQEILSFAEQDDRVKYVSFSRNFGKESAMYAGLRNADGDFIGFIDADLQHSPELIPSMLDAVDGDEYDVAACRRVDRKGESGFKSFLSAEFYKVINKISDTYIDDGAQDFRIMKKQVADAILSMSERTRFTKGIFSWVGFKVKWFPHENRERAAGTTKWSLKKLMKYAIDGILGYTSQPLKIPIYLGGASLVFGLIMLIVFIVRLIHFLRLGYLVNLLRWGSFLGIFIIGGFLLIGLGILGEYVARTYTETQGRPIYIIRETNCDKDKQDK